VNRGAPAAPVTRHKRSCCPRQGRNGGGACGRGGGAAGRRLRRVVVRRQVRRVRQDFHVCGGPRAARGVAQAPRARGARGALGRVRPQARRGGLWRGRWRRNRREPRGGSAVSVRSRSRQRGGKREGNARAAQERGKYTCTNLQTTGLAAQLPAGERALHQPHVVCFHKRITARVLVVV
jgi:hypothetical protein